MHHFDHTVTKQRRDITNVIVLKEWNMQYFRRLQAMGVFFGKLLFCYIVNVVDLYIFKRVIYSYLCTYIWGTCWMLNISLRLFLSIFFTIISNLIKIVKSIK